MTKNKNIYVKHNQFLLTIIIAILFVFAKGLWGQEPVKADAVNIQTNPGFETTSVAQQGDNWTTTKADGWNVWKVTGNATVTVDASIYCEGAKSLKIAAATSARTGVYRDINIVAGKWYKIGAWIKTQNVVSTVGGTRVRLSFLNTSNQLVGSYNYCGQVTGTFDWIYYDALKQAPTGSAKLRIENFLETGTGTAWFDNEVVTEFTFNNSNILANSSFEAKTIGSGNGWTNYSADGWNVWKPTGDATVTVDTSYKVEGSNSVKISAPPSPSPVARASVSKDTNIIGGEYYRICGWIKTDNLTGGSRLRATYYDGTGQTIGSPYYTNTLMGTNEWKFASVKMKAPTLAVKVRFEAFFETGTGTVWFDDFRLEKYSKSSIKNESFEEYISGAGNGWTAYQATNWNTWAASGTPTFAVDTANAYEGSSSVMISASTNSRGSASQDMPVIEGYWYKVSMRIKTQNIVPSGTSNGARFRISFRTTGGTSVGANYYFGSETGNVNWKLVEGKVQIPLTAALMRVECYYDTSTGTAWYDNISVSVPIVDDLYVSTDKYTLASAYTDVLDKKDSITTLTIGSGPANGLLNVSFDGKWTYVPLGLFVGYDDFTICETNNSGAISEKKYRMFVCPTGSQIKSAALTKPHPRLMVTSSDFTTLSGYKSGGDTYYNAWFDKAKSNADTILGTSVITYNFNSNFLYVAREVKYRVETLGMVYKLTGDTRYADKARDEMLAVAAFSDWYPTEFLCTAEMTYSLAFGYDLLFSYMDQTQKDTLVNAIKNKGLNEALYRYQNSPSIMGSKNNWSPVCNGGMAIAALAIIDVDNTSLSEQILQYSMKSLQNGLSGYGRDGSWEEGPVYWWYGIQYLAAFLNSMDNIVGDDFGISTNEGLTNTGDFYNHIMGTMSTMNYADCGENRLVAPEMLWLARKYNKPEFGYFSKTLYDYRNWYFDVKNLIYYRQGFIGQTPTLLNKTFDNVEIATMRSAWGLPNPSFAAMKAGKNRASHGNMDLGSFVYDALGVRWATELGPENYSLPNYWDYEGGRWVYYRTRAEGQNTLVINPSSAPDQNINAVTKIISNSSNTNEVFSIADLTDAYKNNGVIKARRGIRLQNTRKDIVVQDEIQTASASVVYWFMHTNANISIDAGGKSGIMTYLDKQLYFKLLSPGSGAVFTAMNAVPLPTSPNPLGQTPNTGVSKLTINMTGVVGNQTIAVWMVPQNLGAPAPTTAPTLVSLDNWIATN